MYFKEFLRVRSSLLWFTVVLVIISGLIEIVVLVSPRAMNSDETKTNTTVRADATRHAGGVGVKITQRGQGVVNVTVTDDQGRVRSRARSEGASQTTPWIVLFGAAAFFAAIVSTVLGSTLAQENDHLEVAWTRPRSRTVYATTLMGVDALGIVAAQLIAFGFIMFHMAIYHNDQHIVGRPDDALNALRYALFPLAWYGLIVALSAGMRGRASVVQGLIWPVALGLGGISAAPLPDVLRRVFGTINLINPMTYVGNDAQSTEMIAGSLLSSVTFAVTALALIVVASWALATYQWRRLQA
jgi:hypothetical protein